MARYSEVFLFVFCINLALSTMGSIPFYYSSGVAHTIGAGVSYQANGQLAPNPVLNTVGCNIASNQSIACSPPSALNNPAFLSGQVFGWIYGGLIAAFSMAAAPYFVYNLVQSFVNYVPLSIVIAGGLALIYYYFIFLVLTGRYFEQ